MSKVRFKSFSSGSCGNCYYLGLQEDDGSAGAGILIDAGVSPRRVAMELAKDALGHDNWSAILISHDHWDHIKSIGSFCKRLARPVWATRTMHDALSRRPGTGSYLYKVRRNLANDGWTWIVDGIIKARWFEVPHDATQTVGYAVMIGELLYVHITDCGRMTEEAMQWCRKAHTVVLESNYDAGMLSDGPYPPELQERIRGGHGHLSNAECARAIKEFDHEGLRNVFLCHISDHNNTRELALSASEGAFGGRLVALPREGASPMFTLD